ncbi:hypothetical protein GA0070624_3354 [Micromonospora rhizosphaerae]|uniref:Type I phosphodiesterase / nucleotide pyrophosphatase n=1 Tax=Micromonospora rhizosphaerae TaxID=568872 RepID=A0A1C6SB52_9ACTN|nr:hypothetical protein [Micromonospora rhizosphaerae]SCL26685.1 hypothetical protein GA0070624_3354 [Micromonospora rhizosphaerae]
MRPGLCPGGTYAAKPAPPGKTSKVILALLILVAALAIVAPAHRVAAAAATSGTFTDLGPQARAITIHKGAVGTDATGRPLLYAVVYGDAASVTEPGTFVVMDLNTRQVVKSFPLAGQTAAWAITVDDSNRKVTIGSYRGGRVYRYDPDTQTLANLGAPVPGAVVLYVMSAGRGCAVYGGTYPGAGVFAVSGTGTLYNLGTAWSGETHALSTALKLDGTEDILYIGTGGTGRLVRHNLGTGAKADILPAAFTGEKEVYDLNYVSGRLIAKMHPSLTAAVLDPDTGAADTLTDGDSGQTVITFPIGSRGVSPLAPDGRSVYYTDADGLSRLDLTTKTFSDVKDSSGAVINLQGSAIAWGWVALNDPNYPRGMAARSSGRHRGRPLSTARSSATTWPTRLSPTRRSRCCRARTCTPLLSTSATPTTPPMTVAPARYISAIEAADRRIGQILDAISTRPSYADEEWTTIVVTDHGHRDGGGHGQRTRWERTAWIAAAAPASPPAMSTHATSTWRRRSSPRRARRSTQRTASQAYPSAPGPSRPR